MRIRSCIDELQKLGAVSDEQAQVALDRLDSLERSKLTGGQAVRYGALGAGAGLLSRGIGDAIEHGLAGGIAKSTPGRLGAAAVTGGLMAGATPMIRSMMDRHSEEGKLRAYLSQESSAIPTPGAEVGEVPPKMASAEKDAGFLDAVKGALTTPIAGTPELFGGIKSGINQATRYGTPGKGGPSEGFKKFQQQQRMKMAMMAELQKMANQVAPALAQAAPVAAAMAPRALPPMNQPSGLNVSFSPRPRPQSPMPLSGAR